MRPGWAAARTRAIGLAGRRTGAAGCDRLSRAGDVADARRQLAAGPYGPATETAASWAELQRGVTATLAWHLRVLAGWLPPRSTGMLRALAAPLEVAWVEAVLAGRDATTTAAVPPTRLGALATARELAGVRADPRAVRRLLAGSAWGDPGGDTAEEVVWGLRLAAVTRTVVAAPAAAEWARGAAALLLARRLVLDGRPLPAVAARQAGRALGGRAPAATSLPALIAALPVGLAELVGSDADEEGRWLAETAWWGRAEDEAGRMLRRGADDREVVTATCALLAADAWRTRAALAAAAAGRAGSEVFDALA